MAHSTSGAQKSRFAILIGINFYKDKNGAPSPKCLKGAVADVSHMEEYLRSSAQATATAIWKLTASRSPEPAVRTPAEHSDKWPTWPNICSAMQDVCRDAQPGNHVYIHFAGHGTRDEHGSLALVTYSNSYPNQHYVFGNQLRVSLDRMVKEKKLIVTLVLDCCRSGNPFRTEHDPTARFLEYDREIASASRWADSDGSFDGLMRDGSLKVDDWMRVDLNGYSIISACGPTEVARELIFNHQSPSETRRGALSYFLLRALSSLRRQNATVTHETLYERLRVHFRASRPDQTPMRFGACSESFLGTLKDLPDALNALMYWDNDKKAFFLDAGELHGVTSGDTYVAYPSGTSRHTVAPAQAQVDQVEALRSLLRITSGPRGSTAIQTGWQARLATSVSARKIRIEVPREVHLRLAKETMNETRYIEIVDENAAESSLFSVAIDEAGHYIVLEGPSTSAHKIANISPIPKNSTHALKRLFKILDHLAAYKFFEGVENRAPDEKFLESLHITASSKGVDADDAGPFDVRHDKDWNVTVRNNTDSEVYVALLNFTPTWEVCSSLTNIGDNCFRCVESGKSESMILGMTIPEELKSLGKRECHDVFKLIVTKRSTTFPSLMLRPVNDPYSGPNRGSNEDAIAALIEQLTASRRDGNKNCWMTRNFCVRTHT